MAETWHVSWLREGVGKWNRRRKKVSFSPDLAGVDFFDLLPPDYRDAPKTSRYFEGIDFTDADLRKADLSGLNFRNAKFTNAKLSDADMSKSNFIGANFKNADLSRADLDKSLLDNATFEYANLEGVSFEDVSLDEAFIIESNLSERQIEIAQSRSVRVFSTLESYNEYKSTEKKNKSIAVGHAFPNILADRKYAESDDRTVKHRYDVFYGTNRQPVFERGALVDFDGQWRDGITYGVCEVIVPEGHRIGSLGSPLWKRLLNRYDDRLRLDNLIYLNEDLFWKLIRETSNKMKIKEKPTIFIHGFNNTFQDAVLRAAQIGYDLGLGQGIGLFSWPSKGGIFNYSADEAAVETSKYDLANYLEGFVRNSGQNSINIIAHSMGCRCVLGAIEILANGRKNVIKSINQIILAAADVDASIMPHLGVHAVTHAKRITSYISDKDKALLISGWLHSFPRVGITPPTFVLSGMDTILVNDLNLGDFSHTYVGSSRTIIGDMFDLLKSNTPPEDRHAIEPVSVGNQDYWKIRN